VSSVLIHVTIICIIHTIRGYRCRVCRGLHTLRKCQRFLRLPALKRLRSVLINQYCANCLRSNPSAVMSSATSAAEITTLVATPRQTAAADSVVDDVAWLINTEGDIPDPKPSYRPIVRRYPAAHECEDLASRVHFGGVRWETVWHPSFGGSLLPRESHSRILCKDPQFFCPISLEKTWTILGTDPPQEVYLRTAILWCTCIYIYI